MQHDFIRALLEQEGMTASIRPAISLLASMPGRPLPPSRQPFNQAVLAALPDTNNPSGADCSSMARGTVMDAWSQSVACCTSTAGKRVSRQEAPEKSGGTVSPARA